jgi:hypothetical protein
MTGLASHYFSSLIAQPLARAPDERFWIPFKDLRCRRWRPAKPRGHSVSSTLPCISFRIRAKGTAGTFQRGMFPNVTFRPETCFSKARPPLFAHNAAKSRSRHQAWMNSRNQTTIASGLKHRQHVFLHHKDGIGARSGCHSTVPLARPRSFAAKGAAQDFGRRFPRAEDARSRLLGASTCRF